MFLGVPFILGTPPIFVVQRYVESFQPIIPGKTHDPMVESLIFPYMGFREIGVPPNHPCHFRIFHEINHPAIGYPNYYLTTPGPDVDDEEDEDDEDLLEAGDGEEHAKGDDDGDVPMEGTEATGDRHDSDGGVGDARLHIMVGLRMEHSWDIHGDTEIPRYR